MTAKHTEMQARKDRVLAIVVGHYIATIEPVGSQYITEEHDLDISSATVRNILAELEDEGYLSHPHTSAGRMPTQRGYRYYVDHLMDEIQLLEEEKRRIAHEYKRHTRQLEDLLERTSQVLSDLTHYTSIVSMDDEQGHRVVCKGTSYVVGYPDSKDLMKMQAILRLLEEKERLMELINRTLDKKIEIYIGQELALKDMENCSLAVSRFESSGRQGRIAVLGPTRMHYDRVVSALEYVSKVLSQ